MQTAAVSRVAEVRSLFGAEQWTGRVTLVPSLVTQDTVSPLSLSQRYIGSSCFPEVNAEGAWYSVIVYYFNVVLEYLRVAKESKP